MANFWGRLRDAGRVLDRGPGLEPNCDNMRDYYTERAVREGITRSEAKLRNLAEAYGVTTEGNDMEPLKNLGKQTPHKLSGADAALLEAVPNPMTTSSRQVNWVTIIGDQFTSICPYTGAPDSGTIIIRYRPDKWCVESKSFKYYAESFRNEGVFHEKVVAKMCDDLVHLLDPFEITVLGKFVPRGDWSICPEASWSREQK